MLRYLIFSCLLTGWMLCVKGQTSSDPNRSDKETKFSNVVGNPYLFRDWSDGVIRFSNGRVMKQFKLKFDCAYNRLILQFENTSFAAESKVREFVMYRKNSKLIDSFVFRKGFPSIGAATEETFYQVLVDGKVKLLRLFVKNISEVKQIIESSVHRSFEDEEKYFILRDNKMLTVTKDKGSLTDLLPDKSAELKIFIDEHQLKMRSIEDFVRVVTKFNELLP